MTQTNNEREALLEDARKAFNFMDVGDALNPDGILMACIEKFAQLQKFRASPISQNEQQEPFGYFKAEPFGWTDCAETEEGAIPLYESPTKQAIPKGWINAKDRWPERIEGMKILCFGNGYIFEAEYEDGFWVNIGGEDFTHWMPLPSAPTNTEVGE